MVLDVIIFQSLIKILYNNIIFTMEISKLRYAFIRYFCSTPVPFLSHFELFRSRNLFEVVIITSAIALTLGLGLVVDYVYVGSTASYIWGIAIILGMRNNILTVILSISFERAILWHKVVALIALILSAIHGITALITSTKTMDLVTGPILFMLLFFQCISYAFQWVKFEYFYFFHVSNVFLICAAALVHAQLIPLVIGGAIWTVDWLIRYVMTINIIKNVSASLSQDGEVVTIRFPKTFTHQPGQYCFISVSAISLFQYHPFSIASAPQDEDCVFHIKVVGDWTASLATHIRTKLKESLASTENKSAVHTRYVPLDICVEAPLGTLSVDLNVDAGYDAVLLIAGGIGATFTQSIFSSLTHETGQKRSAAASSREVVYVWSTRSEALASVLDMPKNNKTSSNIVDDTSGETSSLVRKDYYCSGSDVSGASNSSVVIPLDDQEEGKAIHPWLFKRGRPDLESAFKRVSESIVKARNSSGSIGGGRCAVLVCGPEAMVLEVISLSSGRHNDVSFDLHSEQFQP